jgi:hypothetical protein
MGGGKGGDATDNPYAASMAKMGKEIYGETDPLRNAMINQFGGYLGLTDPITVKSATKGNPDQTFDWNYDKYGSTSFPSQFSPVYNAARSGIENAYVQGRNNLIGTLPAGGAKFEALGNLEDQRMDNYSNLNSGIANDLWNKVYGLATGVAPQQASSLLGNAGGLYQSGANTNAQSSAMEQASLYNMIGSFGEGAGMLLGGKAKPKA